MFWIPSARRARRWFRPWRGFNIGVEIGQLIVVGAAFPLLFAFRRSAIYKPVVLYAGSACLIAVAAIWFFERTYGAFGPADAGEQLLHLSDFGQ